MGISTLSLKDSAKRLLKFIHKDFRHLKDALFKILNQLCGLLVPLLLDELVISIKLKQGFPGGAVVESLPANAGDTGSSPGLGRSHMPRSD